jgi:hypothetical protein
MLWHDIFKNKNSINQKPFKNLNKNLHNKFLFKYNFSKYACKNYKNYTVIYYIPPTCNITFLLNKATKSYYFYIYSSIYFFKIPITNLKTLPMFDKNSRGLIINLTFINNYTKLYISLLKSFSNVLLKPFFIKVKFKGKGYYLYKSYRNTVTPQFGYSHRLYLYSFFCKVKFLSKTSLICFGLSVTSVKNTSINLVKWRRINIFTGRGVRFSKQIIYKKSGKVSSYR